MPVEKWWDPMADTNLDVAMHAIGFIIENDKDRFLYKEDNKFD